MDITSRNSIHCWRVIDLFGVFTLVADESGMVCFGDLKMASAKAPYPTTRDVKLCAIKLGQGNLWSKHYVNTAFGQTLSIGR